MAPTWVVTDLDKKTVLVPFGSLGNYCALRARLLHACPKSQLQAVSYSTDYRSDAHEA